VSPLRPGASNPTSFVVYDDFFYDFGSATGGDVIDLAAQLNYSGDVGTAIRELSKQLGIHTETSGTAWRDDIQRLCNRTAAYHNALTQSDYDYLAARGFTAEDVERLMIGRVTDGYLKGRLFLPYFKNGAVVYYATRAMPGGSLPDSKYMKASLKECQSYQHIPWGLQTLDRRSDTLIISEGYFDAASWEREGYPVISPITGNFSAAQWPDVLAACRMFSRVLIIFDNDAISHAGDGFTERTAQRLFQARIPFLVAHTPHGVKDVNDYYANGGKLQELVNSAKDGKLYMAERCKNAKELQDLILSVNRYFEDVEIVELLEALDNFPANVKKSIMKIAEKAPPERVVAMEVIKRHHLIYVDQVGFYSFNGKIWCKVPDEEVRGYAADTYAKFATAQRTAAVCKLIRSLTFTTTTFNRLPVLTFQNGTLEIETGKFRDFSPNDYCTIIMDYDYDPDARCPQWRKFINDITDDEPRREEVLQTMAGYALFPDCRFQKIFILLGGGSNGKSVYLEVIQKLFGDDNVSVVMPSGLTQEFQRVKLKDSLLNIGKDVSPDFSTGEIREWLLNISDGTMVQACFKGQTHIDIFPRCKLIYSMNKPPIASVVEGLGRRLHFVKFPCSFVDFPNENNPKQKTKDVNLIPKLLTELPGIFNWAYEGYKLLNTVGYFTDTPEQEELTAQFEEASDPVAVFSKEIIFAGELTRDMIYNRYRDWCEDTGHKPLSRERFIPKFRDCMEGVIVEDKQVRRDGRRTRVFVFKP
jgi:P4 family phage/plasmid primase-like protien